MVWSSSKKKHLKRKSLNGVRLREDVGSAGTRASLRFFAPFAFPRGRPGRPVPPRESSCPSTCAPHGGARQIYLAPQQTHSAGKFPMNSDRLLPRTNHFNRVQRSSRLANETGGGVQPGDEQRSAQPQLSGKHMRRKTEYSEAEHSTLRVKQWLVAEPLHMSMDDPER